MISKTKRAAGILMPITSLPAPFGIGDFGPEAIAFAEFLTRANQRYWQILPLNPIEKQQGFSPYSSVSSMAGNTLLISPEYLVRDGLLDADDLLNATLPNTGQVLYEEAEQGKEDLLELAYRNFVSQSQRSFDDFCDREAYWLDDFALYTALKHSSDGKPWFKWKDQFKLRDLKALLQFTNEQAETLKKIRWKQFIFFKQWRELKTYCNESEISIVGDLPFYVSYDSVDVWAHREIFNLNPDGTMKGVAGVPPDYFNENGQLWGMPVFRWDTLKEQRFDWWVKRIKKNLELFDVVRLDHFRAFSEYWEVPANEKTAVKGKWKPGPEAALFTVLKQELGNLPFVAEDLGDVSKQVYELRDSLHFPGMKVLQFAFGKKMGESDHIPHNFTENFYAYTGTHDNNTTRGWFSEELDPKFRKQLKAYSGIKTTDENAHVILIRLAYASVANTVIVPMQDVLGLDGTARMNMPASVGTNWLWRLIPNELILAAEKQLRQWTHIYLRR
jgi:4-alpha-glucanotransferase